MPVHLFGQMADMTAIKNIAEKYNLRIVEDAAQAIGAQQLYHGQWKKAGTIGDIGCFSFFPSKNLGGVGDGGIVVTQNKDLAEKLKVLRVHGSKPKYYHKIIGGNFRLDPIQAAVLCVKLPYLESQHKKRRENAAYYSEKLSDIVKTPQVDENNISIFNQYTIVVKDRNRVQEILNKSNVGNVVYYPVPLHLQECFEDLGHKKGDFPISETLSEEVLSIPVFPELTKDEQDYVINKIKEAVLG